MLDLLSPVSMKVLEILYPEERGLANGKELVVFLLSS
jgi:hypothetical protein